MIFYKKDNKEVDYIQCDMCGSICNKLGVKKAIRVEFPDSHPDIEDSPGKNKDFCCHHCAVLFLENCQKMIFRLKMRELIEQEDNYIVYFSEEELDLYEIPIKGRSPKKAPEKRKKPSKKRRSKRKRK